MASCLLLVGLLLATCSLALASDPSPLQDFCVADLNSKVLVNGVVCKDPKDVKAEDFLFRGLQRMGNTSNAVGSNVTAVTVNQLAGLNTFGISMARIDFAPWGLNAPHTHPRATEILTVIEGRLLVGFVTSNPENRLITKVLQKGDVFVFPQGLIHFQQNVGKGYALAIAGLSSQNPGVITIANAIFGSNPDISRDILAKAFQTNVNVIKQIHMTELHTLSHKFLELPKLIEEQVFCYSIMASRLLLVGLMLATCSLTLASDPTPLQDFCVADLNSKVLVNGVVCKDPKDVKAEDFLFRGLQRMGNTSNAVGSDVTAVTVNQLAGLNTFGISMARIDFAPWGLNAPHTHPRATEILTVIEGSLLVGFVTSNPENRLITKVLQKGDVFVFPQGLIHFQQNVGKGYALAIAGLSSQNPGVITSQWPYWIKP
ncbi:cupin 1 [Tanacetum coccineum]